MRNVLTVSLYADTAHVAVQVEALGKRNFSLALSVNGQDRIAPIDGFATPDAALDYALANYSGYPLTGAYVEGGRGELDAGTATAFIQGLESKGTRAFRKFLDDLGNQYGIVPADEAEYRTAHTRWVGKGSLFDTAVAVNRLRNHPQG